MKFAVTIKEDEEQFDYELDASDADEAEALAFRAHGQNRCWGKRAFVAASKALDETKHPQKHDINDGHHGAKLTHRKIPYR